MNTSHSTLSNALQKLEETITKAMDRVSAKKASDLCHYLPGRNGHLHHLAFNRLKKSQPLELLRMIKEYVLEQETPKILSSLPKQGLRIKRQVEVKLKSSQINRLVEILKKAGEQELISLLAPHQSLAQVQKLMIDLIKRKEVDQGLWETYVKLIEEKKAALHPQ